MQCSDSGVRLCKIKKIWSNGMYYWNQDNFEGLKQIGEKYRNIKGYEGFANYCIFKEKGIKKEALKAAEDFISIVKNKSVGEQRDIAKELISLSYFNEHIHQLIPYTLQQFLVSVLKDWSNEELNDATPHRWLGYVSNNLDCYEKALEIDSKDEISIVALINASLNSVDYQTHHLSESRFIGSLENAINSLDKAEKLIEVLNPSQLQQRLLQDYQYFRNLINSWAEYKKKQQSLSFPEWSKSKGENYNFWNIFYYDK
jgi:tetratricopeptide (TPR) repeat protein